MSDRTFIAVTGSHGPANIGGGSQILHYSTHNYGPFPAEGEKWTPRRVALDELVRICDYFVLPSNHRRARGRLMDRRTVLLDAPPGSGRRTAATMLLHDLARPSGLLHELLADDEDGRFRLSADRVGSGDQMLLDLAAVEHSRWEQVQADLSSFREIVRQRRGYLVVILPDVDHRLRTEFEELRVELVAPPAVAVLARHLTVAEIDIGSGVEALQVAIDQLGERPAMQRVAELAALIRRAWEQGDPGSALADWCRLAAAAMKDKSEEVRRLLARIPDGAERALLISVAVLQDAKVHEIHLATEMILVETAHPPAELPLLDRADLTARLAAIGATVDGSRRVRFLDLGYDVAIRTYFWDGRPDLRRHLFNWLCAVVRSSELDDGSRVELARKITDLCLRDRHPGDLSLLMEQVSTWAGEGRQAPGPRIAASVLRHGLQRSGEAAAFRRKILEWSAIPHLSTGLVNLLVPICSEVIAAQHPEQAMVRLHHLARRHGELARPALLQLVTGSQALRRQMFDRFVVTFQLGKGSDQVRWEADVGLFLELSAPSDLVATPEQFANALLDEQTVRRRLAVCWRNVLLEDQKIWGGRVESWLDAAADSEQRRELLLGLLTEACGLQAAVQGRLNQVARAWANSADTDARLARSRVVTRLLALMRAAMRRTDREPV
ncbi:hypothetical protein [Frankia sp. AgKG'84/4]|uniref:hypothetical protein n=1 Tax=Frankia sp. AgKG'84/4 TaxID=573490 RepID=UPI00200E2E68|nr:hypothetical protein [Frankia sp. AgKG'84/4]MCL9796084.1 hypothetical protein [Frankia sp. AgKG'84/4]